MGFQCGVPGDYDSYKNLFLAASHEWVDMDTFADQVGWMRFSRIFVNIGGFPVFIFFISLVEYLILARTINIYCEKKYRFLAGLIFYFSMNLMLFQMKGLRQGLAIELGLLAFYFIDRMKIHGAVVAFIISIIAISFHKSYWLFVPFLASFFVYKSYFCSKKQKHLMSTSSQGSKTKKPRSEFFFPMLMSSIYVGTVVLKALFITYAQPLLLAMNLGGYEGYFGEMQVVEQHFLITMYGAISVFFVSWYAQYSQGTKWFIAILALLGLLAESLFFGQGNMFRFSLYIYIFIIFAIPNAASFVQKKGFKKISFSYMLLSVAYFWRTFITLTIRHSVDGFDNYTLIFLQ